MIKAAFFDIDGTLISHKQGIVPADTIEAVKYLRSTGIKVFTSTGRHMLEMEQLPVSRLEFDGHVLLNGQLCLNQNKEVLYENAIPEEDIQKILPWFEEGRLPITFVEKDRMYINFVDERVRRAQKAISTEPPAIGAYTGNHVYLLNVYEEDEQVDKVLEMMPHCKMTRWNSFGVDIIARGGGKVTGMTQILKFHNIPKEDCIAFGDGENDIEMLKFAGIGVAMGNAEPEVKACADYVTGNVDEGGIWNALKHFKI